jgi:hypothetical protein
MTTSIALAVSLYFLAPALSSAILASRVSHIPCLLTFVAGFVVQHLITITLISVVGNFGVSLAFSAALLLLATHTWTIKYKVQPVAVPLNFWERVVYHTLSPALFLGVFVTYLLIRSYYPFLAFVNDGREVGVEKLFNLSLHQSFLFGEKWPVEWIWLADEPIRYYVFLKAIPGIVSWLARVVCNETAGGGVLFILSEAFFAALTPAVMSAWLLWFWRTKPLRFVGFCAVAFPLVSLLGYHFKGFWLGLDAFMSGTTVDWWQLADQVTPFTQSHYPVWLMLLGDNHAYSQAYFLQALLWGAVLQLVLLERTNLFLGACVGGIAGAVALSHPGSILVDLATLAPFVGLVFCLRVCRKEWKKSEVLAKNCLAAGATSIIFLALLYQSVGNVKFLVPELRLTTGFIDLLSQNFSILVVAFFILLLLFKSVIFRLPYALVACSCVVAVLLEIATSRSALPCSILLASITALVAFTALKGEPDRSEAHPAALQLSLFVFCAFLILIPPEVIAIDHVLDKRTDWIRFQMSLRFFPEAGILVPFALALVFTGPLARACDSKKKRRLLYALCSLFIATLCVSHIPGIKNRISRTSQVRTVDGFSEFYRRYPSDTRIIQFLRDLPPSPSIMVGELCSVYGYPAIPEHFGWPGRIAAYSGRRGLCGWGRHAALYNSPLTKQGFRGMQVEEKIQAYTAMYQRLLSGRFAKDDIIVKLDKQALSALGVTHLVVGEWERALFPKVSAKELAEMLGGTLALSNSDGTGIVLLEMRNE